MTEIKNRSEIKKTLLHIAVIFLTGLLIYLNTLNGDFIRDDHELIKNNVFLKDWAYLPMLFTKNVGAGAGIKSRSYRPLQMFSYMVGYSLYRLDVRGYHLSNIILHLSVALAFYWLARLLFGRGRPAFFAAFLFTCHPVHTGVVSYISGRADALVTLFLTLAFISYLKAVSGPGSKVRHVFTLTAFAAALLSKEIAVILPVLLLLYHFIYRKKLAPRFFSLICLVTLCYLALRLVSPQARQGLAFSAYAAARRVPGFFAAITGYLGLLLLPITLKVDYGDRLFSAADPRVIAGLFIILGAAFLVMRSTKLDRTVRFSIGWFFVALIPSSNIYPINAYMAEHWLYIPSFGFFLLVAYGLEHLCANERLRKAAVVLLILLAALYGHITFRNNGLWNSPLNFYGTTLKYTPDPSSAHNGLGLAYQKLGEKKEAARHFKRSIEVSPGRAKAYVNLALLYHGEGRDGEAIGLLKKAIRYEPSSAKAYNNLAMIYADLDRGEEAELLYKAAIKINPYYPLAYYNLANLYYDMGRKEKAIDSYRRSIELGPDYPKAYYNLGCIYQVDGDYEEAKAHYEKALSLNDDYLECYVNLALVYSAQGKDEEAVRLCKEALRCDGNFVQAHYNLGNIYRKAGRNQDAIASYTEAVSIESGFFNAYFNLGNAYLDSAAEQLAIDAFKEALKIRPDSPEVYYNMANAYMNLGDTGEAIVNYGKSLEIDPDDPKALLNLATAYSMEGRYGEALQYYEKAEELGIVDKRLKELLESKN